MHPTRDTTAFIYINLAGRRVMPGVGLRNNLRRLTLHTFAQKPKAPQQATPAKSTVSGRTYFGQSREVNSILHLQRTIGNQAVLRLLEDKPDGLEADSDASASGRFGHDFSQVPINAKAPVKIQPKLAINPPGDIHEQEADRISEQVVRISEPQLQHPCACGRGCQKCQAKRPNQEHFSLQTERVQASDTGQIAAPPMVHEVLAGPGQPLDSSTRDFMEPRFGYDFSRVRIHSDARAAASAQSINALAYTVGTDVVFAAAQFSPATAQGRKLLAHELTHVVQQDQFASSVRRAPRALVQRRQTSVQPAPVVGVDPGATCNLDQHRKIEPAAHKANQWLSSAIPALDAFLSGAKTKEAQAAAAALSRHFHSFERAVVIYVRDRLKTIQSDIFTRQNFRVNCPPASDAECNKTSTGQAFAAVVSEDQNELNFCAQFFSRKEEDDRASTIIHEFGHALLGLSKTQRMLIIDRAYKHDAYYAYLTTGEALTNAESYAMFAREVATGSSPAHAFITDTLRNCPDAWVPIISDALSTARAWNHRAALHTPARHQFSTAYKRLDGRLKSGDSYKCIPDGGGRCSARVVAYWYAAGDLRICPSLIGLPTPDERALSLLAALYAYQDLVSGDDKQQAAAREARRLHTANVPTTADVLTGA